MSTQLMVITVKVLKANKLNVFLLALVVAVVAGCSPSAKQLKEALESNPDILTNAIEKNQVVIMDALQKAAQDAQRASRDRMLKEQQALREDEFKNPKIPALADDRASRGPKEAPIVLVEYADFQCPYCRQGYDTVREVEKKYGGSVRFVYKHLPLDFHPLAMPAAKRFEAIALQSEDKAMKFHDEVFSNQDELAQKKEEFLDDVAGKVGADVARMRKDMESPAVQKRIKEDMEEAKKFGFQGTPSFLVSGISFRGVRPFQEFEEIIERVLKEHGEKQSKRQ